MGCGASSIAPAGVVDPTGSSLEELADLLLFSHSFRGSARSALLAALRNGAKRVELRPGQSLAWERADQVYVLQEGRLEEEEGGGPARSLSVGDVAGLAGPASMRAAAGHERAVLWSLPRQLVRGGGAPAGQPAELKVVAAALRRVPGFAALTEDEISRLAAAAKLKKLADRAPLEKQGKVADRLYVLQSGIVACNSGAAGLVNFGLSSLLRTEPSTTSCAAKGGGTAHMLKASVVSDILGSPWDDVLRRGLAERLAVAPALKGLGTADLACLGERLVPRLVRQGEVLVEKGVSSTGVAAGVFILDQGSVRSTSGEGRERNLGCGEVFGLPPPAAARSKRFQATVAADVDALCWTLSASALGEAMEERTALRECMARAAELELAGKPQPAGARQDFRPGRAEERAIQFQDLEDIDVVGVGSFGQVKLVKHRGTGKTYALKCMHKALVGAYGQKEHVMNEKAVMSEVAHLPFVNTLIKTFKDRDYIYILLEPVLGGEVFSYLKRKRRLNEKDSAFFAANIALFFEGLHNCSIIYRDLKPENMLLDSKGYICVCDFGFAKKVQDKTFTLCGTTDYIAPEVVQNKGHNRAFDWWTLGIFIYEMICGYTPFAADTAPETYQNVCNMEVYFPKLFSRKAKDLIRELLRKDPKKRLGMGPDGAKEVKKHAWFADLSWEDLLARTAKPPFVPCIADTIDTRNFDEYDDEDTPVPPADYLERDAHWCDDF